VCKINVKGSYHEVSEVFRGFRGHIHNTIKGTSAKKGYISCERMGNYHDITV